MTAAAVTLVLSVTGCSRSPPQDALPQPVNPQPASPQPIAPEPAALPPAGTVTEHELEPGASHRYLVDLAAGELLHVIVDQRGIDAAVALVDDAGGHRLEVDRPIDDLGPEELLYVTEAAGRYQLEVSALPAAPAAGRYGLRLLARRPATPDDRQRAAAAAVFAEGEAHWWHGELEAARERYAAAAELWRPLDGSWHAEALHRLGVVTAGLGQRREAAELFERSAAGFLAAGDERYAAIALSYQGEALFALGEIDAAHEAHQRALPLRRSSGDPLGEAITLNNLGQILQLQGQVEAARDAYEAATRGVTAAKAPVVVATARHNLGSLYRWLGQLDLARQHLTAATDLWVEAGSPRRQAATLNQLGRLHREAGDPDAAREAHQRALALRREAGDPRGQAAALSELGQTLEQLGRDEEALLAYTESLSLLADLDRPRSRAKVELYRGVLLDRLGKHAEADGALTAALELTRRLEEPGREAAVRLALARAAQRQGRLTDARGHIDRSLELLETLRSRVLGDRGRGTFFATVQPHFDAAVDLLFDLEAQQPNQGFAALALETHERSRSRVLLDRLLAPAAGGSDVRPAAARSRADELAEIIRRLAARRQPLLDLLESLETSSRRAEIAAGQLAAIDSELRTGLDRLDRLRGGSAAAAPALGVPRIQDALLDADSALIAYRLAEPRSFVWALTDRGLLHAELPGRSHLDRLSRQAHRWLRRSHRRETGPALEQVLCELSRELLAPIAPALRRERLLLITDGGLHYLPFAALPHPSAPGPCREAPPLIADHEIAYLTSATAAVRRLEGPRPNRRPPGRLAVVADPVFSVSDERLGAAIGEVAERDDPAERWARLPFSGREAEAILAHASGGSRARQGPTDDVLAALGADATKRLVTGGRLAPYRILHFATHGVLDTDQPELSALVLSRFDASGRQIDATLHSHEIAALDLPADLAVLSACRTALGEELRGEGLVGLAQAFFAAGTARVLVSLWPVADQSTAELMDAFYRRHLGEGASPASALRAAQRELSAEPARTAPYYWAGFVLLGDPR